MRMIVESRRRRNGDSSQMIKTFRFELHRHHRPASADPCRAVGSFLRRCSLLPAVLLALGLALPASAATLTRSSAFTYAATSGLLAKEVMEPADSTLCLVTEYAYDTYGNKTAATTRNCNGSPIPGIGNEAAAPSSRPGAGSRRGCRSWPCWRWTAT